MKYLLLYKWNFYVFSREAVLINKINMSLHMIKLLWIQDGVSGWGQSFVCPPSPTPPPPPYSALLITWVCEVMCHSALQLQCERMSNLFWTSFPGLVFLLGLLCPHLYWAEYFYVANVVKVLFINFSSTQVTWFCLLKNY